MEIKSSKLKHHKIRAIQRANASEPLWPRYSRVLQVERPGVDVRTKLIGPGSRLITQVCDHAFIEGLQAHLILNSEIRGLCVTYLGIAFSY